MPVGYAGNNLLPNCRTDLGLGWVSQQRFPMEPPQAESPQVRHGLHQLEVQGEQPGSARPKECVCEGKGENSLNSLPLENKHRASERQQPLQTRGNVSPTSMSWQWIHLELEGDRGLLSPVCFTQSSEGEKPQNVNRQLVAHCFFRTFRSRFKTPKTHAWHTSRPCCLCENVSSVGHTEGFYGNNIQVKAVTAFDGCV